MVPLRLKLNNFMCYRDNVPTLDLEGVHVACLCGDNGHGKSALLDAITWALWGEARTRTHEELIHLGRRDMSVELDFTARGQTYRVSRKYSRTSKGSHGTLLELQVISEDIIQPITGNTMRDTEAKIKTILNMDYRTFVNTAFLLQGKADQFTRSTPAQRKECLAEVLDLAYYQRLEELSKERTRKETGRLREIEINIGHLRIQVDQRPESMERIESIKRTIDSIQPELDAQKTIVEKLRDSVDVLRNKKTDLVLLDRRLDSSRGELDQYARQIVDYEGRIQRYESLIQRKDEISERFGTFNKLRTETANLDQAAMKSNKLNQDKIGLNAAIEIQRERLSAKLKQLENHMAVNLEPKADRLRGLEAGLLVLQRDQESLSKDENNVSGMKERLQEIAARIQYLKNSSTKLVVEMEETRKKFDMLGQGDAVCPLCNQQLGDAGQEHLAAEYRTQGEKAKLDYQEQLDESNKSKREHDEQLSLVTRQESELESTKRKIQSKIIENERDIADSREAVEDLTRYGIDIQKLRTLMESDDFALDDRTRLTEVNRQVMELKYDPGVHDQVREQIKEMEPYVELNRKLSESIDLLLGERDSLDRIVEMRQRRKLELDEDSNRRDEVLAEITSLPSLEAELSESQIRHSSLDKQMHQLMIDQGVVQEELKRLDGLQDKLKLDEGERKVTQDSKSIYDELAVAFGRNGIQALIIESAIPQLQEDANELLGRLTEGQMTLKLELREGRKERLTGMPSEELDIRIADEVGTRAYETFSGGEAFRIDFALRIALSKLLAQRSGAPLPTLFIDEGFGSQDTQGKERLTEAIQSIQADFRKIIVITHIEDIKDAFPTRIEVTKTESGSTFELV